MKRPANVPPLKPGDPHSAVYAAARREYNEQVSSIVAQCNNWRLTALGALAVAFVSAGDAVWDHQNNHSVPYVVEVNKLGDGLTIARADVAAPLDQRVIRSQLARWVVDVRTVYVDVQAEKRAIGEAFAMTDRNGAAGQTLKDWWGAHEPFGRARDEVVAVAVQSVLPLSGNTWRVEWCEDVHPRQSPGGACDPGAVPHGQQWQATITVSVNPPADDAAILANFSGLYVESFDWSQRQ